MRTLGGVLAGIALSASVWAGEPDWSSGLEIHAPRSNPYDLSPSELLSHTRQGRLHALHYPVAVTGSQVPYRAAERAFRNPADGVFFKFLKGLLRTISPIESLDDFFEWLGLHEYPEHEGEPGSPYYIPFIDGTRPELRMGAGFVGGTHALSKVALTVSCAECHSSNLFGHKIIGLTNRFPRANLGFVMAMKGMPDMPVALFKKFTRATREETGIFAQTRESLKHADARVPQTLGLDTSLAQVALSLAKRERDEWASFSPRFEARPRDERLRRVPSDSKPAVWWNLKYKNRWLADGSVISGNPIFTNFLWNEIGRGTDLKRLDEWFTQSEDVVRELTTAVFASEAPRFTDFFPDAGQNLASARRGESVYQDRCARCHGTYEKAWSLPHAQELSPADQLATVSVDYPEKTRVMDVGTDPLRWQGMQSLVQLNDLSISKRNGIVIEPQEGYVPPPLVGIWARWPYFHNNSVPSLCALLTLENERPRAYWAGEALSATRDFDRLCNGYPTGRQVPSHWKRDKDFLYDTRKLGLSNRGHQERILVKDGQELMTREQKWDLISFLQTL